jgi:glycosyltransferase involved in cell wall biosynthesis
MKNILFINHSNKIAGAETVLLAIINIISKNRDDNIYVITPNYCIASPLKERLENMQINCFSLPYKNIGVSFVRTIIVLLFNLYSIVKLIKYIKKNKINIIYSNTSVTGIGIITAMFMNMPHVWHYHESTNFENYLKDNKLKYIYRFLLAYKKNHLIFISNIQKEEWKTFIGREIKNSRIIYNPIKHIDFSISKRYIFNDYLTFGYLGSLSIRKNISLLIKTFYELYKSRPDIRLLIGGDGPERCSIINMIKEYSLNSVVVLQGYIENISVFFSNIDVFILPSISECWPLVALEAFYARKPAILSKNMGLSEILKNNQHCIFFDPVNSVELLSSMKSMMNEEYRNILGDKGFKKVNEYDFNAKFEESFKEVFDIHSNVVNDIAEKRYIGKQFKSIF